MCGGSTWLVCLHFLTVTLVFTCVEYTMMLDGIITELVMIMICVRYEIL